MATLAARLLVTVVLLYSGIAKLGRGDTAGAARDLGLSPALARWIGVGLAPLEILVGLLLVPEATLAVGALLAVGLFVAFTLLVSWNLRQGRRPACACFGEASREPISSATLWRNVVLVLAALTLVIGAVRQPAVGLHVAVGALLAGGTVEGALGAVVLLQVLILIVVLTRPGSRPEAPPIRIPAGAPEPAMGWPIGTLAPAFDLPALDGSRVSLRALLDRGRPVILVFTAPDCPHCVALMPEVQRWQEEFAQIFTVALVSRGSEVANRAKLQGFEIRDVLLQGSAEVADAYQCPAVPSAVVIDGTRRIASRVAAGPTAIRDLVEGRAAVALASAPVSILSPPPPSDGVRVLVGDPAPPFRLPSLREASVDLAEFGGQVVVLIFWSPTCRYCREFAPALEARESDRNSDRAQVVFVATGTRAALEAERFASPVLLDEGGAIARAFGASGTPQAVLIDATGRVGSGLSAGALEIQALLDRADLLVRTARRVAN